MTNLILILLITLLDGILADNSHDFNDFGKEGEIILNKIDVSKDRTLFGSSKMLLMIIIISVTMCTSTACIFQILKEKHG